MNQAEKETYLREYSILKNEGKPFFPYAVAKDALMAVIVMAVIIFLALMFGAEMGPKVNPTTRAVLATRHVRSSCADARPRAGSLRSRWLALDPTEC